MMCHMRRREFLPTLGATLASAALAQDAPKAKGRIKQGVTRGVFQRGMAFEETCKIAADLGMVGYDLIGPQDWPTLKKYSPTFSNPMRPYSF